ncbi:C-C motif chemokine 19b [Denticeps clupeoides]|uniref:Chemokine interleukin-8-like domain-containing protein n=1 Tax=Denticeps clupeoides TaxID=299321 RepID=A0AAY4B0N1_9TELE|nr:C-C motif chemokine 19-like [Denticeps clupeoides]
MIATGATLHSAAVLLLACALWSCATASTEEAVDCCLRTSNRPIPHRIVKSYRIQAGDSGCTILATVFVTVKKKKLCAPDPFSSVWVSKLIQKLEKKAKKGGKNGKNNKG